MDELSQMSHAISTDQIKARESSRPPSPKRIPNPTATLSPSPGPSAAEQKEMLKKLEKVTEEKEKAELRRKIKQYLANKKLMTFIPENIKEPGDRESLEVLRSVYGQIISALQESHKRIAVHTMFDTFLNLTEKGMVQFLEQHQKRGMANFLIDHKEELFEPELEEMIIEMEGFQLSPKTRLLMKLGQILYSFDNRLLIPPEGNSNSEEEKEKEKPKEKEKDAPVSSSKKFPSNNLRKGGAK